MGRSGPDLPATTPQDTWQPAGSCQATQEPRCRSRTNRRARPNRLRCCRMARIHLPCWLPLGQNRPQADIPHRIWRPTLGLFPTLLADQYRFPGDALSGADHLQLRTGPGLRSAGRPVLRNVPCLRTLLRRLDLLRARGYRRRWRLPRQSPPHWFRLPAERRPSPCIWSA